MFDDEFDPRWDKETSSTWDFLDPSKYSFNSNYVEISGSRASLKTVDQNFSGTDFNSGSHVGTYVSGSNVTLLAQPNAVSTNANTVLSSKSSDILGYWRFENNFNDSTTNSNDGVAINGAGFSSSDNKFNSSHGVFSGSGSNKYVDLPTVAPSTNYSVSMWVKTSINHIGTLYTSGPLSGCNPSVNQLRVNNFTPQFRVGCAGTFSAGEQITSGEWSHIVYTVDSSSQGQIFINGRKVLASTDISGGQSLGTGNDSIGIGFAGGTPENAFNGEIDEVAVWSGVLTDEQVLDLYNGQNANFTELSSSWTPHYDNIVGYWKMDGNWQDSSGNGNHGTANGDASFDTDAKIGNQSGIFDGTGDYISIPDSPSFDLTNEVSITGWVKLDNYTGRPHIIGKNLTYYWVVETSGRFRFYYYPSGWIPIEVSGDLFPLDQWVHITTTYSSDNISIYFNGILVESSTSGPYPSLNNSTEELRIARGPAGTSQYTTGRVDDLAIIHKALNNEEVLQIYNRQKQKYAGHYDSPVIDLGTTSNWTNLDAVTSLPFGKEIVAQASENSSDYSSLSGDLSNGLVGHWTLNETGAGTAPGGNDLEDFGSSSAHMTTVGTVNFGRAGVLSKAVNFSGVSGFSSPDNNNFDFGTGSYTISAWINPDDFSNFKVIVGKGSNLETSGWRAFINNAGRPVLFWGIDSGGGYTASSMVLKVGEFSHVIWGYNASTGKVFYVLNGEYEEYSRTNQAVSNTVPIRISGDGNNSNYYFDGEIDEVAIWSRALSATEIQQLYRRGANRIKYQVKSCVDSSCNCKAYNTSPAGSASDCDGDGTPNSSDTDDIYMAEFIGPGGDGSTQYSELFNRAPSDLTFSCSDNNTDSDANICVDDEITLAGDSNVSSPSFTFSDMATSAAPANNRYFQYRVIMEAEENTACSGEACLPELTSVEIGPTGRYYGGSPVVSPTTPISYNSLNAISFTEGGSCSMTYQLSSDGSTYYYHNGSAWVAAGSEDVSLSTSGSSIGSNITSFPVSSGSLYFKAFMTSDTSQACTLDQISITKPDN